MTPMEELRSRIAAWCKWRAKGTKRRMSALQDWGVYEVLRWTSELSLKPGPFDTLAYYVASQLWHASVEVVSGDNNASRCRIRRLEGALRRFEERGRCPWRWPSRYERQDRLKRMAAIPRRQVPLHDAHDATQQVAA